MGARVELEGEIKGGKGGERGRMRFAWPRPIHRRRWKGEAGRDGGGEKMGGKVENKSVWARTARGRDARGVRGKKIFPSFFADPPFALPAIPL